MPSDPTESGELVERLRGDRQALTDLFQRYRDRLRRMVELRMDARLQGRVDASDVLQDAFLDAAARLDGYLRRPDLPPFLWLRLVVAERLAICPPPSPGDQDARRRPGGLAVPRAACPRRARPPWPRCCWGTLYLAHQAAVRAEQVLAGPGGPQRAGPP